MAENLSFSIERVSPHNTTSPDRKHKALSISQSANLENSCPLPKSENKSDSLQSPSRKTPNAGLSEISLNSPERRSHLRESPLQSYLKKQECSPPKRKSSLNLREAS